MKKNIITCTDSYKFMNNGFLNGVTEIYSYFESRQGAQYPTTVFFGLQYLLKEYLVGVRVTQDMIEGAKVVAKNHLGGEDQFNIGMWQHIVDNCGGSLPIEIRATPEGSEVDQNNVLMTITNTDPKCAPLVNHLETLLTNVWSGCIVATKSKYIKRILLDYAIQTCDGKDHVKFQLHDFAQRSVKCPEAALYNGIGHLINFYGTDTVLAWEGARDYYGADVATIGYSVFATEHNYMMYKGREGESSVVGEILDVRPKGIISVVADTYDIYNFVENIVGRKYKERILERDGVFVIRPDSITPDHDTPAKLTLWIAESLWKNFGAKMNCKGFRVLDSHVRIIYGDSLTEKSITNILETLKNAGFSSENVVFGCGSYLLDKHNRDTQRSAYKSSAMKIDGVWAGVFKSPLGSNKKSKRGRLKLCHTDMSDYTLTEYDAGYENSKDDLVTVFRNGEIIKEYTLDDIRKNNNF